uniref:Uncharacterized protein n=1 Tax=Arundo donax TaxID=35708 RepID=A0A0A8Y696_ARUDO
MNESRNLLYSSLGWQLITPRIERWLA